MQGLKREFLSSLAVLVLVLPALAADPQLELGRKYYNSTDFDKSLAVLEAMPKKSGEAWALMGRDYYMETEYKKAGEALERAVAAEPANAEYVLWLGRAYGRRAETSSPLTAAMHANHARQQFEKAVQLNPRYLEALSDLFDYYMEAPGFLGGGLDKAQGVAAQIAKVDAGEGHYAQARLAEKRKQFGSAEEQLRSAIAAAPKQVGRFVDLAKFLAKQGRIQESDQSLASAERIAPDSPKLMYAKADLYIKTNRNLEAAKDLLKRYLNSPLTPEDPPRSDAQKLLRQVQGS
jgi:tetratricopeptide (TPR) repeat protein